MPRQHYQEAPRYDGKVEPRWDMFEDVGILQSEAEGLGGAEGATDAMSLHEECVAQGYHIYGHCNCNGSIGVLVSWSECAAIAHRVNPAQINLDPNWAPSDELAGALVPLVPCKNRCRAPAKINITAADCEKALRTCFANGYERNDPNFPKLWSYLKSIGRVR